MNSSDLKKLDFSCKSDFFPGGTFISPEGEIFNDLPEYRKITWSLSPEPESYIRFEMWLPKNSSIFVGAGNGGMAGNIPYSRLAQHIKSGYAVAASDMGTSRGMKSGIECPAVWRDFGWRATHIMTVTAKEVFNAVYGRMPEFSYFSGSSTGGQQAFSEAQRFPKDYDGILCGAPASNRIRLHTYFLWNFIRSKDINRRPLFDKSLCEKIHRSAVDFCKIRFSGENGADFVSVPRCDSDTVNEFISFLKKKYPFLTPEQSDALNKIYSGPENIFNGIPMGSELSGCSLFEMSSASDCPHSYPFYWALGENFDLFGFDFSEDFKTVFRKLSSDMDATDTDLTEFSENGGKIIIVSGGSDAVVPYFDTLEYCNNADANGCLRFWLAPSYSHNICALTPDIITAENGDSMFETLRKWREEGTVPDCLRVCLADGSGTRRIKPIVF